MQPGINKEYMNGMVISSTMANKLKKVQQAAHALFLELLFDIFINPGLISSKRML